MSSKNNNRCDKYKDKKHMVLKRTMSIKNVINVLKIKFGKLIQTV